MRRIIGGIETFPIGLGCMGMTMSYGPVDKAEAAATVQAAVDAGVTLFDTAQMYGGGRNEAFIGPLLEPFRDDIVLATKSGIRTRFGGLPVGLDGRPESIRKGLDASLKRLRTDRVDLYYLHRVDPKVPLEDSVGALADGVHAGKVRAIGLSEVTGSQLRRAHAVHPVAAVQMEWSLFSRTLEDDVLPVARELGVGIVTYSPLGRGMLTGSPAATTNLSSSTTAASCRAGARRTSPRTSEPWTSSGRSRPATTPPSGRSPWPGCSPEATTSSRSPVPNAAATSRRTSRRWSSGSARRISSNSTGSAPRATGTADSG